MKLILVSYPDFFKGETSIVSSLLDSYDFTFHLRKPQASKQELIDYLDEIPTRLHSKIVLHNEIEVFSSYKLEGMHFSGAKRESAQELAKTVTKGTSCHSISEIKSLEKTFDYVYLSPIFESISKQGYQGNLDMEEVKVFLEEAKQNQVYALGGIAIENIHHIKQFAFDGLAVLGAVWTLNPLKNRDMIQSNFNKIYSKIQSVYEKSNS
ncbi:thiamine phosphate synthase [Marinifilum caeruleilacunae]|uniref:Thiamine phosphate synthase n=1 Tax=Marinifilum caeruleilacunae TaxID=2499076 RepID=A0ABX1WRG2_9BACT|nr:thiamine phosphate synthase [Marinifilum caeruleilacunae]NOU58675.1 thiamine phosphate synthase [Marinifilum caeruleilacunae]